MTQPAKHTNSPVEIWPVIDPGPKPQKAEELRKWKRRNETRLRAEQLKEALGKLWPELVLPHPPPSPVALEKAALERLLEEMRNKDATAYPLWQAMLRAGLRKGGKLGWFVGDIPKPIVRFRAPGSPITPGNFALAARVSGLRRRFIAQLPGFDLTNREVLSGAILISAVLFGGLLDRTLIRKFSCIEPLKLQYWRPWVWIELESSNVGGTAGRRGGSSRRWVLDALSSHLLVCWRRQFGSASIIPAKRCGDTKRLDQHLWKLIQPLLEALDPGITRPQKSGSEPKATSPGSARSVTSLTQFAAATELALRLHIAPLLINVVAGKLENRSLPEHAWLRLITGKRLGPQEKVASEPPPTANTALGVAGKGIMPEARSRQYEFLRDYKRLLRQAGTTGKGHKSDLRRQIEKMLKQTNTQASPILIRMMEWGLYRLGRGGGAVKASALHRNLASIGTPFVDFFGSRDPSNLSPEEFLDIYESVRDTSKTDAEMVLRAGLCVGFHQWLSGAGLAQEIDVAVEIGGVAARSKQVDANLVTAHEYIKTIDLLQDDVTKGVLYAKEAKLATILAMRLGLRLSEIFNLRVGDVRGSPGEGDLIVRKGKSANARRVLPVWSLIPLKEERAALQQATAKRAAHEWLLHEPGNPAEPADQQKIVELVVSALRAATGDASVHFHHLRHAHVSWLYFMLLPSVEYLPILMAAWGDNKPKTEELRKRAQALIGEEIGYESPSRKSPHAIAIDAGHASPEISLFSYAHLIDLALHATLEKQLAGLLTPFHLCGLLGISDGNLRVIRTRLEPINDLEILPLRALAKLTKPEMAMLAPDFAAFPLWKSPPPRSRLKAIAMALNELDAGRLVEQVALRYSLPANDLHYWHKCALVLADRLRGPRGGRHVAITKKGNRAPNPVFNRNLSDAEWALADQVHKKLTSLCKGVRKDWANKMLDIAIRQGFSGHNELWFNTPGPAAEFMEFAALLGIPTDRLRFVLRPRTPLSCQDRDRDVEQWKNALGVAIDRIEVQTSGSSGKSSKEGVMGIQVAAESSDGVAGEHLESPVGRRPKFTGSPGFWTALRFFIVLRRKA